MKNLEELKQTPHLKIMSTAEDGGYGELFFPGHSKAYGSVIWSYGGGWDHVSVSPYNHRLTPSWDEMCRIKEMFFYENETVVEYHPAKSNYVNVKENCLHLWKPQNDTMPTPPLYMV